MDKQPQPVVNSTYIAAAVQAVIMLGIGMAVSLGWFNLSGDQMGSIEKFVTAVIGLAVLLAPQIIAAYWARKRVTPIAAPRTADGQPAALVPLAQAQAMGLAPAGSEAPR